jgi:8-oxo-dGTP diphosphatase
MPTALTSLIAGLVSGVEPADDLAREHRRAALSWLAGTDDIFRRAKPRTPSPHLVSYFLLVDRTPGSFLLGAPETRHVDVSLWFALTGHAGQPLRPDQREFAQVRWWTVGELHHTDPDRFEPHLLRALNALGIGR